MLCPLQSAVLPVMERVGFGVTLIVTVVDAVQAPFEPLRVYVVEPVGGVTEIVFVVAPVLQV